MENARLLRGDNGRDARGSNDVDAGLLWRMPKPMCMQQLPLRDEPEQPQEPEDDDSDDNDSHHHHIISHKAHRHVVAAADAPSPQILTARYASCAQSSERSDSNRSSDCEHITLPTETRSAPARHGNYAAAIQSRPSGRIAESSTSSEQQSVHARLLPLASSPQPPPPRRAAHEFWQPVASTTTYGAASTTAGTTTATSVSLTVRSLTSSIRADGRVRRHHSILRFGSTTRRPMGDRSSSNGLKKSASVEFTLLDDSSRLKHAASDDAPSYNSVGVGRDAPRRLTEEEKEALYRVRPDLEIGPSPFFQEQLAELERRNQQRVLFAMFGGVVSIVLLLVFYALLAQG